MSLWSLVLSYLPSSDLSACSLVCRSWQTVGGRVQSASLESTGAGLRAYRAGFLEGADAGRESALQAGFNAGFAEACSTGTQEGYNKGREMARLLL
jgi:hypothetical protein